jgi:hypothetical protein
VLLLESFVEGIGFSIESLIHEGRVDFENIVEEADSPAGKEHLELGYTLPASRLSPTAVRRAYQVNRDVLRRLQVQFAVVHAEYKSSGEQIFLMELAVRVPGDGLLAMYECSTGTPLEHAIIDSVLGVPPRYPKPERPVRQLYFEAPKALLLGAELPGIDLQPAYPGASRPPFALTKPAHGIRELRFGKAPGESFGDVRRASERHGSALFEAKDFAELEARDAYIRQNLQIVTNQGKFSAQFF